MRSRSMLGLLLVASFATMANDQTPDGKLTASLCAKGDLVLFSCPLAGGKKIVSMCAVGPKAPHHFYYAFGREGALELVYPQSRISEPFARSFLTFAGGTGGYAYTFSRGGYKYIVYDISGAGFEGGGLMVQRSGSAKPVANMQCAAGQISERTGASRSLSDEVRGWPHDPDISSHGLPFTPDD